VRHLRQQGYVIVERNYRGRGGEIDIVAEQGDVLCFVEVRSRATDEHGDPLETVDRRKQQRVVSAARQYLADHDVTDREIRFDVIGIVYRPLAGGGPSIALLTGAFEESSPW
jgi:putative endonuclease